jgi:hypothetical protein
VLAIVAVFVAASLVTPQFVGDGKPQFSEQEEALRGALEPRLAAMLLQPSDLGDLSQNLNDCTNSGGSFTTYFQLGNDESGESELRRAEANENSPPLSSFASFCDEKSQVWVSSLVELPRDEKPLRFRASLTSTLAESDEEALRKLVAADNSYTGSGFEPGESSWLDVRGLGTVRLRFDTTPTTRDGKKMMSPMTLRLHAGSYGDPSR